MTYPKECAKVSFVLVRCVQQALHILYCAQTFTNVSWSQDTSTRKRATSRFTRLGVRTEMKRKFDVTKSTCVILATAVACSDSFINCHECQSYLNSITNDDRDNVVQIVFKSCASGHSWYIHTYVRTYTRNIENTHIIGNTTSLEHIFNKKM